jgi:calcium binding protein 39
MKLVLNENKGIQYEAFLLLSLFILMPKEDERVSTIITKNKAMLIDFIEKFQNDRGKYTPLNVHETL